MIEAIGNFFTPEILLLFGFLMLMGYLALISGSGGNKRVKSRLMAMRPDKEKEPNQVTKVVSARMTELGNWVAKSPMIGAKEQAVMSTQIASAGIHPNFITYFISIKILLMLILPLVSSFVVLDELGMFNDSLIEELALVMGSALAGWKLPDFIIGSYASSRRKKLEHGIADALDLMVICVEAGLGLEQALDRVSRDIAQASPVVSEELSKTVAEMRVLPQMRDALDNFAKRSDLQVIRSVMATLIQAVQYGTPLSQSLRILAAEMRNHRMLKIEEKAARLPVMMTIPLIIFIMPCLFLVIAGPAILSVLDVMQGK